MQEDIEKYLPWFILKHIPSIGNRAAKDLIDAHGDPEHIFRLSASKLAETTKLSSRTIHALTHPGEYRETAIKELEALLAATPSITILPLNHPFYPALLKQIPDPPIVLTCAGDMICREKEMACIGIVGSRSATSYGMEAAAHFARELGKAGFTIVSGMARGIDSAAHWGALEAGANTVAVLGSGLGKIYPPEHKNLFQKIRENGSVLSEFALDAAPLPAHFPVRNRIIAGMSLGVLVVEAAQKSGSLITARLSCEYNREVFAIPGSIVSAKSSGTHFLLKQGAILVENTQDIVDELKNLAYEHIPSYEPEKKKGAPPSISMDKETACVYNTIGPYPVHIDTIIETCAMESARVSAILLDLELSKKITRHPGNYFSRTKELL